jgi:DNA-directed RNA polymerase subunit RPC12/RpoP
MKKLDSFREVFKTVKHRKPAQIFCPRCASPKIHLSSGLDLWLTPKSYICEECGYTGLIVMELEKENEENTKENKEI